MPLQAQTSEVRALDSLLPTLEEEWAPSDLFPPTSQVLRNRGVYENVKYVQQENFWIGPSSVREEPGRVGGQGRWAGS